MTSQRQLNSSEQLPQRHRNCLLHECCFWAYHLIVICLGMVILSKIIDTQILSEEVLDSSERRHAQETVDLWNQGYIIDIKAVNTNNCPEGYSPLLEYTWPGTNEGCYCSAALDDYSVQYILEGICTSELIDEGCTQIEELQEQQLQLWKGGKLICLKRAESQTFYESVEQTSSQGAAMGKCAESQPYEVSTLPNVSCPVTRASNLSLSASATTLELDSANSNSLHYVAQNGYPIADFKVTEYAFCEFLDEINISPDKVGNYKLEKIDETTCPGTDSRYVEFDSMNEEEFFTNNTRVYDKISSLPGYPRPSQEYVYKLGYIPYPTWTYACRTSQTHHLNQATTHLLYHNQSRTIETLTGIAVPCTIIFAVFFRIFFVVRHVIHTKTKMRYNAVFLTEEQIGEQLPSLNLQKNVTKEMLIFALEMLLRVGTLAVVLVTLLVMFESSYWTKETFQLQCTDTYVEGIFRFYEDQTDETNQILVEICFIWVALVIIDVAYLIIRFQYIDLFNVPKEISVQQEEEVSSEERIKVKDKEFDLDEDNIKPQESSDVILDKKSREIKVREIDDFMADDGVFGNAAYGETKDNFYGLENSDYNMVTAVKRKPKKVRRNNKNAGNSKKK